MNSSMKSLALIAALGSFLLGGCIKDLTDEMNDQPRKFPNDSNSRVLNEMRRPIGTAVPATVSADDRDARLAALEKERADLEALLAAERAKVARLEAQPPQVIEKRVEVPVETVVEKTKIVKVPLIELRADALFDSGKAELRPNAVMALKNAADALKKFSGNIKTVQVDGHADNRRIHSREFPSNQALSEARAKAVAHYLVKHSGLPAEKFVAIGHGDSRPIADNKTVGGQSQNRRVEVTIMQVD